MLKQFKMCFTPPNHKTWLRACLGRESFLNLRFWSWWKYVWEPLHETECFQLRVYCTLIPSNYGAGTLSFLVNVSRCLKQSLSTFALHPQKRKILPPEDAPITSGHLMPWLETIGFVKTMHIIIQRFYKLTSIVWCKLWVSIFSLNATFLFNPDRRQWLLVFCLSVCSASVSTACTRWLLLCETLCLSISVLFYCLIYAALSTVRKDRKQQNLFSKGKLNWGQASSRKQHMNNLVLLVFQPRYQMFVVEQLGNDIFNKGRLMNTGYQHASNASGVNFDCYIFHDVDMLLENDKNIYKYIDFIFPCHHINNSCFSSSEKPLGSNGVFKSYLS